MKLLILAFIAIAAMSASTSTYALSIPCNISTSRINFMDKGSAYGYTPNGQVTVHAGFWSLLNVVCETKEKAIYGTMEIFGPGLMNTEGSDFTEHSIQLTCPLVSEKRLLNRLSKNKSFGIAGPIAAAALGPLGVKIGTGVNARGAVCFINGFPFGFGAEAGIATLKLNSVGSDN